MDGESPPMWASVLLAAKEWGVPPWEIAAASGDRLIWYFRWAEFTAERIDAEKRQQREQNG